MNDAAKPARDTLIDTLRLLCAQPSVAGQPRALADGADTVASILRDVGLDCTILKTPGAPLVIGRYNANTAKTVLLYGRYDVPAPGLRRSWTHDPFQPTVHNDALFARGATIKAELVARAAALRTMIAQSLPVNIVFVVEGDSLVGSPHLHLAREAIGACAAALWSGGSFGGNDGPLLYTGVKGLLQVALEVATARINVPAAYAATVPNPLWTLVLALASIKSEFEEILIEGFYDEIAPPSRAALNSVQQLDLGEQQRRAAWGVDRFIANVSGAMLARTEIFSPAVNISTITATGADVPAIPQRAGVDLQFQLVPDHQPEQIYALLAQHLARRGFDQLKLRQLPGAFGPAQSAALPFDPAEVAAAVYGAPTTVVPLAPFSAPVAVLAPHSPFVSCGLERPTSALLGPDEHVALTDLELHTQFVTELLWRMSV